MDTLLSPAELLAFQSFLSAIEYGDPASEWSTNDELTLGDMPRGKESLAQATKDLMALDPTPYVRLPPPPVYEPQRRLVPNTKPALAIDPQFSRALHRLSDMPPLSDTTPASPLPPYTLFRYSPPLTSPSSSSMSPPVAASSASYLSLRPDLRTKRPASPSTRSFPGPSTATSSSAPNPKRARSSVTCIPAVLSTTTSSLNKQTLLSPSQKKANHIQSEQKRRANIRRGYEALCSTVPALREAILAEEEEEALRLSSLIATNVACNSAKKGKTRRGKKTGADVETKGIDGRAGPRSENVVLSKTIEYIMDVLAERDILAARLKKARSALPPGHPVLASVSEEPLWEREWKGGVAKIEGEGEEGEDSQEKNGDGSE